MTFARGNVPRRSCATTQYVVHICAMKQLSCASGRTAMFSHHRFLNSANSKLLARANPACTNFVIGTDSDGEMIRSPECGRISDGAGTWKNSPPAGHPRGSAAHSGRTEPSAKNRIWGAGRHIENSQLRTMAYSKVKNWCRLRDSNTRPHHYE